MESLKALRPGSTVEALDVLIERRTEAKTKKGDPFLRLTIRDKSGALEAVMWSYRPADHSFPEGSVVRIFGQAGAYNDKVQITITEMEPSAAQPMSFAKSTRFDVQKLWGDVNETVELMTEPLTQYVTTMILNKVQDQFKRAPAAKTVHNAWYGGLLEHVWSLTRIAEPIIAHYQRSYEPAISRDRVMFGLIMHDAGKIFEYDFSKPSFTYTAVGTLTPHIVLGPAWVYEQANHWWAGRYAFPAAANMAAEEFQLERAHLMHILAAHHGQVEWGSPVVPASIEAILVHHLDNLDSKVLHALELIEGPSGPIPGFSERSYFEKTCFMQYPKPKI